MNNKQYEAVVDYFRDLSPFDDDDDIEDDAEAGAAAINEILKENEDFQ